MSSVNTILKEGHKIASGKAIDTPYPAGSITLQSPHFKRHGIDISSMHPATLNLSIDPHQFEIIEPEFTIHNLHWAEGFPSETFSFSKCKVRFHENIYKGFIYYPHPETKLGHFHDSSIIEIIADYIPDIKYGDEVVLEFNPDEITLRHVNS